MSNPAGPAALDLDHADFSSPRTQTAACGKCEGALSGSYWTLGDRMLCERCHFDERDASPSGSFLTRALGALVLGCIAAVVAGALWMLVTKLSGYEIGLIAIVVGLMVGVAVRIGARGVGGLGYQLLAVFLTYSAIVMTYVPDIVAELRSHQEVMDDLHTAAGNAREDQDAVVPGDPARDEEAVTATLYVVAVPIAYAAPFLMGVENLIGIAIIGFALYEAWKINRRVLLQMQGPFRLGAEPAAVG